MHLWQLDLAGGIFLADGRECKMLTGISDHSRFVVITTVLAVPSGRAVADGFVRAMRTYGVPTEILTDNGKQFTGRFARPRTAEVLFERAYRENGVTANLSHRCPGVARLAKEVMALDEEIAETDALIEGRFRDHPHAEAILSMPGLGPVLGAEFIAHTGRDMSIFGSPDRLAVSPAWHPVPKDSGRISGNMRRPRHYCRRLMQVFYISAQVAARCCPTSKAFHDRKRAEKKSHKQAVIAIARRRLNVLWALIRDGHTFETTPPPGLNCSQWATNQG